VRAFRSSEAARLAGLTRRRLDYWDRAGLVRPSVLPASGRGSARLYSFRDLVLLRAVGELRSQGAPVPVLRQVVRTLAAQPDLESPPAGARLVVRGQEAAVARTGEELAALLDTPGPASALVLNLAALAREVAARAGVAGPPGE
jgi:DNA-binding transcriptional MerR regulator